MSEGAANTVEYKIDDRIATITINRPQSFNAINHEVLMELEQALHMIEQSDKVGIIIITGAGDKAFAAGADISYMNTLNFHQMRTFIEKGQTVMSGIENCKKVVIAALNGHAFGGGMELALACDFRIALNNARLGLPEVSLGIIPGWGGTQRLAQMAGKSTAKEWILTGSQMDAVTAAKYGIVHQVVHNGNLMDTCRELATKILNNGPIAVRLAKEAINKGLNQPIHEGLNLEAKLFMKSFQTADRQEGFEAFLEKRAARFKGQEEIR